MKKVLVANNLVDLFTDRNSFVHRADIAIFTAATYDEMLEIHNWEAVDLIITQPDLPGIDCEKFFSIVKKSKEVREVSTILICKDSPGEQDCCCKRYGPDAIFTLPVDTEQLHETVRRFFHVSPRKLRRSAIAVAIQSSIKNTPHTFWSENLSTGGMLIKSKEPLSKGDSITFSFKLPDGTRVNGFGEISRGAQFPCKANAFLYGIKFIGIHPTSKSAIAAAIEK